MALLNIITEEDPRLGQACRRVDEITPRIIRLLDDMKDTLHKAQGVGLAAPQVGVLRRIAIVEVEEGELIELINPEVIDEEGEQEGVEGCLSVPRKWGVVKRAQKVKVKAMDRRGNTFIVEGEDLLARALCHEIDHLDGHLYTRLVSKWVDEEDLK